DCYGRFVRRASFGGKRVKILFAVLTCIVWVSTCLAGERSYSPANGLLIRVGWQESWFLPRRFRNYCSLDVHGHAITVPIIAGPTMSFTIARKSRSAVAASGLATATWTDCCAVTREGRYGRFMGRRHYEVSPLEVTSGNSVVSGVTGCIALRLAA